MYKTLFFLLFVVNASLATVYSKNNRCPRNQEFSKCGNNGCQNTCENPTFAQVCRGKCNPGCVCKEGYLKNSKGDCVLPKDCPNKCPKANQIFSKCNNNPCQNTCEEPFRIASCSYIPGCYPGCICKDGYLKNSRGDCVPNEQCIQCTIPNEVVSACGAHPCLNTCEEPDRITRCTYEPQCFPGCVCEEGYLRNSQGLCAPADKCPPRCDDPNAFYNGCGNLCALTCKNKDDPPVCAAVCRPETGGCECNPGYAFDAQGTCIKVEDCPSLCTDPNEKYYGCKPCKYTCENPSFSCTAVCTSGCECKDGYIRKSNNDDTCIPKESCPSCPANEVYQSCGTACPLTCENKDNPPTVCTANCVEGCFCKEGYVRDTASGNCVLPETCPPPPCPANEEFQSCGTACPLTCENKDNPPTVCTANCVQGCFCKEGYVRDTASGSCVLPETCPPPPCPENEEFQSCGTACPLTCENKDNPPQICTLNCVIGCFCKEGFVRNTKSGKCVLPDTCPAPTCRDPNSEYLKCKRCVGSCDERNPICDKSCNPPGCYCKVGYVKKSRTDPTCIKESSCPTPKPPKCGTNEVWSNKCPIKQENCSHKTKPVGGTKPGCCCKPGYVRECEGGSCIPKNKCKKY